MWCRDSQGQLLNLQYMESIGKTYYKDTSRELDSRWEVRVYGLAREDGDYPVYIIADDLTEEQADILINVIAEDLQAKNWSWEVGMIRAGKLKEIK